MEVLSLSFGAALLMGLAFGAGPCSITCLPYLGPVFLTQEAGWRRTLGVILPFSVGRLVGYTALGTVAGYAGYTATHWFKEGPAGILLGIATVVLGVLLLRRAGKGKGCKPKAPTEQSVALPGKARPATMMPLSLFGLGMGMALNPCVPLGTVLTVAAASASPWLGAQLGLAFGIGAVVIPAVFFGIVVAHFGLQVRQGLAKWQGKLEAGAGGMLILLGSVTALGWVQP
ncbi:MAG: sulfite exporter TauE/SafE family protein [Gammaproteobacteria bacterium]|nr:sulfite exporter TauE/SafE family protein [Gammaproteobacteria bacterium]